MLFRRIYDSFLNMGIINQVLSSTVVFIITGYLIGNFLLQPLTVTSKSDKSLAGFVEFLTIMSILTLLVTIITMNAYLIAKYYQSKYPESHTREIFYSTDIVFMQGIRNKVVVGLDNIRGNIQENYSVKPLPSVSSSSTMLDHFPSDMRNEISSKIRGKTIFTLIEIAYQDPTKTTPSNISKSLNIPPSSLSREIKRLVALNYLETHVSDIVLQDGRLRNFKITPKGFYFLSRLNNALKITIDRLKLREGNSIPS